MTLLELVNETLMQKNRRLRQDDASRRLRPEQLTRAQALESAKVFARRHG